MANTPSEKALRRSVPELNTAAGSFAKVSVCVVIRADGVTAPVPALAESSLHNRRARHRWPWCDPIGNRTEPRDPPEP